MSAEALAAWTQALGSIAAIVASVLLINYQQSLHVRRRARSLSALLGEAIAQSQAGLLQNQLPAVAAQWGITAGSQLGSFSSLSALFGRLDLSEIDSAVVWREFSLFSNEFDTILRMINEQVEWSRGHIASATVEAVRANSMERQFRRVIDSAESTRRAIAKAYRDIAPDYQVEVDRIKPLDAP